jgi:Ca-activated chloride channel family protein
MDFLWSSLLALLVVVPAMIGIYIWSQRRRRRSGVRYSSLSLVHDAMPGSSRLRRHLPFVLFVAALAALVVGMARPVVILAVPSNQTTIILTIDVSGSMCSSDIPPSRLEAAEAAAAAFIKTQSSSTQIGIVAFSGYAQVVQTPTNDQAALLAALQSLATGRRTGIGDGILASIDAISQVDPAVAKSQSSSSTAPPPAPVVKGAYAPDIIVLLTDGANNTGTDPLAAAQQAADRGVRVYTIGFGTANGGAMSATCEPRFQGNEPGSGGFGGGGRGGGGGGGGGGGNFPRGIDEATLKQIASMTGATYHPASTSGELNTVFQGLPTNLILKHEVTEVSFVFVGLGALIAGLGTLLGKAWRPLP